MLSIISPSSTQCGSMWSTQMLTWCSKNYVGLGTYLNFDPDLNLQGHCIRCTKKVIKSVDDWETNDRLEIDDR